MKQALSHRRAPHRRWFCHLYSSRDKVFVSYNDERSIEHIIKVVQDNSTLLDISGSQITELDYSIPVTLERNSTSIVKVFVEMKNGKKLYEIKRYGVNK